MQETGTKLLESRLPAILELKEALVDAIETRGDLQVTVKAEKIRAVIALLLRTRPAFNVMMDLFAIDYLKFKPQTPERFAVVYSLLSSDTNERVFLKAWLPESKPEIDSIHDLYKAANWFEREAWDLYGVTFKSHPNLQRILCHNEFVGHPLRKDYPSDQYQRLKTAAPPSGF